MSEMQTERLFDVVEHNALFVDDALAISIVVPVDLALFVDIVDLAAPLV